MPPFVEPGLCMPGPESELILIVVTRVDVIDGESAQRYWQNTVSSVNVQVSRVTPSWVVYTLYTTSDVSLLWWAPETRWPAKVQGISPASRGCQIGRVCLMHWGRHSIGVSKHS